MCSQSDQELTRTALSLARAADTGGETEEFPRPSTDERDTNS